MTGECSTWRQWRGLLPLRGATRPRLFRRTIDWLSDILGSPHAARYRMRALGAACHCEAQTRGTARGQQLRHALAALRFLKREGSGGGLQVRCLSHREGTAEGRAMVAARCREPGSSLLLGSRSGHAPTSVMLSTQALSFDCRLKKSDSVHCDFLVSRSYRSSPPPDRLWVAAGAHPNSWCH